MAYTFNSIKSYKDSIKAGAEHLSACESLKIKKNESEDDYSCLKIDKELEMMAVIKRIVLEGVELIVPSKPLENSALEELEITSDHCKLELLRYVCQNCTNLNTLKVTSNTHVRKHELYPCHETVEILTMFSTHPTLRNLHFLGVHLFADDLYQKNYVDSTAPSVYKRFFYNRVNACSIDLGQRSIQEIEPCFGYYSGIRQLEISQPSSDMSNLIFVDLSASIFEVVKKLTVKIYTEPAQVRDPFYDAESSSSFNPEPMPAFFDLLIRRCPNLAALNINVAKEEHIEYYVPAEQIICLYEKTPSMQDMDVSGAKIETSKDRKTVSISLKHDIFDIARLVACLVKKHENIKTMSIDIPSGIQLDMLLAHLQNLVELVITAKDITNNTGKKLEFKNLEKLKLSGTASSIIIDNISMNSPKLENLLFPSFFLHLHNKRLCVKKHYNKKRHEEEEGDEAEGDETEVDEAEGDETEGDEAEGDETEVDETEDDEEYQQKRRKIIINE